MTTDGNFQLITLLLSVLFIGPRIQLQYICGRNIEKQDSYTAAICDAHMQSCSTHNKNTSVRFILQGGAEKSGTCMHT